MREFSARRELRREFEATAACDVRPDIVLYGEAPRGLGQFDEDVQNADLVLCVGTSLTVDPLRSLVRNAAEHHGKPVVIVNSRYLKDWSSHAQLTMDADDFARRV